MQPKVNNEKKFYQNISKNQISNFHLNAFNYIWRKTQKNIPYYKRLVEQKIVPHNINTWEDFMTIPVQDRVFVRENISDFSDVTRKADRYITTGGSTGTPLKYP